jgi:hypothetical protein
MEKKYIQIFDGYKGAYGVADWTNVKIDPVSGKKKPDYRWNFEPFTDQIFIDHLNGVKSVGIQPTNENSEVKFGLIDIDPNNYVNYDKKFFIDKIQEFKLPLIPIESKSGGLHLFIFMKEFVSATLLVSFLKNLLPLFNLKPDCEIFPKQTQLTKDTETGELRPGQFINLPYYKRTERQALNVDGTPFTFEQFIKVVEANLVEVKNLDAITEGMDKQIYEGTDEDFKDGPPCLAHLSKIMKDPKFDGKDRFMYNYHVFVKMKYPDTWKQKVKNAPVKYFEEHHAHAWDDKLLNAKLRSWNKSEKGFTCTQEPLWSNCKKGICVKKKFGVLAGSKGNYPELTNLKKIALEPEPEFEFDVTKSDGFTTATVHCKSVEHLTDQRKRRNAIAKDAGFAPPIIKSDQAVLDALFDTQKVVSPPIGTTPKEKLHDVLHAKINGAKALVDASFKTGTVLIEDGYAFFKFNKFYDKLKAKDWKYSEDKTGTMMMKTYKDCGIEFMEGKRFPKKKDQSKSNTPTKNVVKISIKEFENVPIHHTQIKHKTEIL